MRAASVKGRQGPGCSEGKVWILAKAGRREIPQGVLVVMSRPVWIPLAVSCSGRYGLPGSEGHWGPGREFGSYFARSIGYKSLSKRSRKILLFCLNVRSSKTREGLRLLFCLCPPLWILPIFQHMYFCKGTICCLSLAMWDAGHLLEKVFSDSSSILCTLFLLWPPIALCSLQRLLSQLTLWKIIHALPIPYQPEKPMEDLDGLCLIFL